MRISGKLSTYSMVNSPMLSIFQHFHAIPLRSPLISLRSKWRLTGFSRRFTPKNPVRLHNPIGELPRWGAKNVLLLNLIALPARGEGASKGRIGYWRQARERIKSPDHRSQAHSYPHRMPERCGLSMAVMSSFFFYIFYFQTISFHDIIRITHFIGRSEVGRGS